MSGVDPSAPPKAAIYSGVTGPNYAIRAGSKLEMSGMLDGRVCWAAAEVGYLAAVTIGCLVVRAVLAIYYAEAKEACIASKAKKNVNARFDFVI
jgi:hypothetical protein